MICEFGDSFLGRPSHSLTVSRGEHFLIPARKPDLAPEFLKTNVSFWLEAVIHRRNIEVRFAPKSGHPGLPKPCRLLGLKLPRRQPVGAFGSNLGKGSPFIGFNVCFVKRVAPTVVNAFENEGFSAARKYDTTQRRAQRRIFFM